ncbi:MAG: EamA family transporter [Acidimicrobiia bacterium]
MEIALSLLAAGFVGTADFLGGVASRRGHVFGVALWVQIVGVGALLIAAPFFEADPSAEDWLWGAVAGAGGGLGVLALYRGFAASRVGVVAPVSAVSAAALAVLFGVVVGDRPESLDWIGIFLGVIAIALVSRVPDDHPDRPVKPGLMFGLLAGLGFAVLYIAFSRTGADSGAWPLLSARVTGSIITLGLGWLTARHLLPDRTAWKAVVASGLCSVTGNFAFIAAAHIGLLAIVAVITSLYPAATVGLARIFFHERLSQSQLAGLALAIAAVAVIAL